MNLSGNPVDFIWAFFGGVLVSFTPCAYPLLPIIVAFIGGNRSNSRVRGFTLSLTYVAGISLTYTILGLAAVLTGTFFGKFTQQPIVHIIAGLVIILFGFALWTNRWLHLPKIKSENDKTGTYLSCFVLGVTSGFLVTPCVGPALGSILVFAATTKSFIYGALLLFSFAFGMGLLIILAGTFSSILTSLPKSGRWMVIMKKICAVILVIAGIYFVASGIIDLVPEQKCASHKDVNLFLTDEVSAQDFSSAPNFTLSDIHGVNVSLSAFKYKHPVVLIFWTTWCPYCVQELRYLNKVRDDFVSEGIKVLAVNVQESRAKVAKFVAKNKLSLRVLLDKKGEAAYEYRLVGVPTYVLINKQSEIVFADNRFPKQKYKTFLLGE